MSGTSLRLGRGGVVAWGLAWLAPLAGWAGEPVAAAGLQVEGLVAFTEGPAWHAASGNVYFTDIENNRIMRRDPKGMLHTFRQPAGRANGLAFDAQGRLVACEGAAEGGNRRVTRTELDGSLTVLADHYQGKKFNAPNDLVIDSQGRIYFTDPRYGDRSDLQQWDDAGKPVEGVYRIDPDGQVSRVLAAPTVRPNGICLSRDERTLFVADNDNSGPVGNRRIWSFPLDAEGRVDAAGAKVLFDWGAGRGPDGMCLGPEGHLYVAAGTNFPSATETNEHRSGIYVLNATSGALVQFLPVPEDMITNCTFGGADGRTLFITAGHKLWSLPVAAAP